ncbi:FKBP-type peptidyl-prolyl cis-trans isomerase [Granulicella tundricola]|uniref:Peptidyl-prolyl cis-trans isomerase n=1 Tax=Granulicella tundricola (strain ATCC BAA-1859 / DSM 23138 / MP5ACTX9) TaxID=1198114 RepID=E8WW77_GRATM|nr:FKBP-type peptidyl-prolyl cis-trans isomerase [Granulicella tundricola]ADW68460.1 peptidylprolyl isomerase FKBP-type [Granulicella tundricola MP5ACTX9]
MKLTPALVLLSLAAPALAQTAAKPAVHHSTTATHRAATGACADMPLLDAKIPKIAGCPKTLFALRYIDTLVGTGPLAMPLKLYTVNYTGYLLNGTKFDSSVDRKDPIVFPAGVHRVITGWDTGFEGMHVGGKRRLFIPYELAYGDAGKPPTIPAKSMLVFDVELIAQADFPQQPPPQPRPATATPPPASTKPADDGAKPATIPGADPTKPTTVTPPAGSAATPPATTPKP